MGGELIAAVGMANCFFLNSASFLAVLLALVLIKLPPSPTAPWKPFLQAWRELFDHLLERRELKLILVLMSTVAIFAMPYLCAFAHPGPGHPGGGCPGSSGTSWP